METAPIGVHAGDGNGHIARFKQRRASFFCHPFKVLSVYIYGVSHWRENMRKSVGSLG